MKTRSYLRHVLLVSLLCLATISQAAEIIFRPGPGLNDGTDTGTAAAGKDTFGGTCDNPGANYGSVDSLYSAPQTTCNSCNSSSWLRFDVSALPSEVTKVYLGFTHRPHPQSYCYGNCNADFYFYPVTADWGEMTVSRATPPTKGSAVFGPVNIVFPNDLGNKEYDITDLYRQWKSGAISNHGIEISSPTSGCNNASVAFYTYSSDAAIDSQRPYLRVVTPDTTETTIFTNDNLNAVSNGPTSPTTFSVASAVQITYILTYHWNGGSGSPGGTISLKHSDGTVYGPWTANTTLSGTRYWEVRPGATIKAGTYTVQDSNPSTWSYNSASGNAGIAIIKGIAGSASTAIFDVTATASGGESNLTLTAAMTMASEHVGKRGEVYLAANYGSSWFFNNGAGWNTPLAPYFSGTLPATMNIPVVSGMNVSSLGGLGIYAGYGTDVMDMVNSSRYKNIYTVAGSSPGSVTSATIGTSGGTVSAGGISIAFPSGATSSQLNIAVSQAQPNQSFTSGATILSDIYKVDVQGDLQQPISIRMATKVAPQANEIVFAAIVDDLFVNMSGATPHRGIRLLDASAVADGYVVTLPANIDTAKASAPNAAFAADSTRSFTIYMLGGYAMRSTAHFNIRYPLRSCNGLVMDQWLQYAEEAYSRLVGTMKFDPIGLAMPATRMTIDVVDLGPTEWGGLSFHTWTLGILNNLVVDFQLPTRVCNSPTADEDQEAKVTIGHEFFHGIQNTYDPAPALVKTTWGSRGLCLYEASSAWFEAEMLGSKTYLGAPTREQVFEANGYYTRGLGRGCATDPQGYGYGAATFLRYLTEKYGADLVLVLWRNIFGGAGYGVPIDAMINAGVNISDDWEMFSEKLLLGTTGLSWPTPPSDSKLVYQAGAALRITDSMYVLSSKKHTIDFTSLLSGAPPGLECRVRLTKGTGSYRAVVYYETSKVADIDQAFTPSANDKYSLIVTNVETNSTSVDGIRYGGQTPVEASIDCAGAIVVTVSPEQVSLAPGATQSFGATVTGATGTAVTWSVLPGGGAGGTITSNGVYTAPTAGGTYHVVATSQADKTTTGSATVTVSQQPIAGFQLSWQAYSTIGPQATDTKYFGDTNCGTPKELNCDDNAQTGRFVLTGSSFHSYYLYGEGKDTDCTGTISGSAVTMSCTITPVVTTVDVLKFTISGTLDAQKSITNLSTTGSYTKSGTTTSRLMVIQTLKFY